MIDEIGSKPLEKGIEKPFRISIYHVTNIQYDAFLNTPDGYHNRDWWEQLGKHDCSIPSWQSANHPRETVSWYEAVAFCHWLTYKHREAKILDEGRQIRLPTEWEWQLAATGGDQERKYPWGYDWNPACCNSNESRLNRTTAVGIYPAGATAQGVMDMAGNIWEWCLNKHNYSSDPYGINVDDSGVQRVMRGGAWFNFGESLCSTFRNQNAPSFRDNYVGFRVVQSVD
jgi:formylglycine-generating enzyme required for sulfatase activity